MVVLFRSQIFFALGRTFVHLLTGIHPLDLCDPYRHDIYTDELENWRDKASQISSVLADFIDQLMARPINERPPDTQTILQQLVEIDQTLHPRRLSRPKPSNPLTTLSGQNISLERTLSNWYSSGHSDTVWSVAISPDGQTLVSGGSDNLIKIWNLNTGEEIHTITGHSEPVYSVAISPDGQTLISSSDDNTIKVWNLTTDEQIYTLTEDSDGVFAVAISPDGQTLVTGSKNGKIKVWYLTTGEEIYTLNGHFGQVNALTFSTDGEILVSASQDSTIKVWKIQ
jgi:uncharacterized protein with WD repeat